MAKFFSVFLRFFLKKIFGFFDDKLQLEQRQPFSRQRLLTGFLTFPRNRLRRENRGGQRATTATKRHDDTTTLKQSGTAALHSTPFIEHRREQSGTTTLKQSGTAALHSAPFIERRRAKRPGETRCCGGCLWFIKLTNFLFY
ncbi:MAG: hypothetical protein IJU62_04540 [Muribaculaceae bacterium]|nr:hypothetical protein [Muribaculaceae bacterium]